jgi:hypothetical protein
MTVDTISLRLVSDGGTLRLESCADGISISDVRVTPSALLLAIRAR